MAAVKPYEIGQLPVEAGRACEVGVEHEQAALGDLLVDLNAKGGEIGFPEGGLLGVKGFEECLHLVREAGTILSNRSLKVMSPARSSLLMATKESTSDALMA